MLDFLSAALLSAEYDRALSRALAMAECPVVPFFGAFLRELREILASGGAAGHESGGAGGTEGMPPQPAKPPKAETRRDHRDQQLLQQRQVVGERINISFADFYSSFDLVQCSKKAFEPL